MDFSICHTTARPNGWQAAAKAWTENLSGLHKVEYVMCIDERWGFDNFAFPPVVDVTKYTSTKIVWNTGRKCSVDGWNTAAAKSTGDIIILAADDVFPPPDWDAKLESAIHNHWYGIGSSICDPDFVVQTRQGTVSDLRGLITLQILSRARYERLGYALNPQYEALYADDEFTEQARMENRIVNARHLFFEHRHPIAGKAPMDEQYMHQNNMEVNAKGLQLLQERRMKGFPPI